MHLNYGTGQNNRGGDLTPVSTKSFERGDLTMSRIETRTLDLNESEVCITGDGSTQGCRGLYVIHSMRFAPTLIMFLVALLDFPGLGRWSVFANSWRWRLFWYAG